MDKNVVVAYVSQYGATKEIAEKIGEVLREAGLQADVSPVDGVRDLNAYKAVVFGSGVYIGNWPKKAAEFIQANEKILADRPVWLFSTGPTGKGDPVQLLKGWRLPTAQQPVADRIHPRDIAIFHGFINPDKLNFIQRWVIKNIVKAPFGDFRDWDMIVDWTTKIAGALKGAE